MTLHAFYRAALHELYATEFHRRAHHLSGLCTLLDVHYELLLLLLELRPLTIELALRLREGALMLTEPLCGRDGTAKEGFLCMIRGKWANCTKRRGPTMIFMVSERVAEASNGRHCAVRPHWFSTPTSHLATDTISAMDHGPVLDIGAHCSMPSCNLNDFLPIRCKCERLFCRNHIVADTHNCPVSQFTTSTSTFVNKLQRCTAQGCSKPSLEAYVSNSTSAAAGERSTAVCARCQQSFCAS